VVQSTSQRHDVKDYVATTYKYRIMVLQPISIGLWCYSLKVWERVELQPISSSVKYRIMVLQLRHDVKEES
jgi:hypothetical protein